MWRAFMVWLDTATVPIWVLVVAGLVWLWWEIRQARRQ